MSPFMAAGLQIMENRTIPSSFSLFRILLPVLVETDTSRAISVSPICGFKTKHFIIFKAVGIG
jgi:hypothetical protein